MSRDPVDIDLEIKERREAEAEARHQRLLDEQGLTRQQAILQTMEAIFLTEQFGTTLFEYVIDHEQFPNLLLCIVGYQQEALEVVKETFHQLCLNCLMDAAIEYLASSGGIVPPYPAERRNMEKHLRPVVESIRKEMYRLEAQAK